MKNSFLIVLTIPALILCMGSCKKNQEVANTTASSSSTSENQLQLLSTTGTLVASSDFNNSAISYVDPQRDDLTGINVSPYDWTTSNFGKSFRFYYEGGTSTDRKAVITTDDNSTNNILKYIITNGTIAANPPKARVQVEIDGFKDPVTGGYFKEFYQSVRMKLHYSSFKKILDDPNRLVPPTPTYDPHDWLTLFELWNNNTWGDDFPFRIGITLKKSANLQNFNFEAGAQKDVSGSFQDVWKNSSSTFVVPLGTWMTVDIYFKEGTAGSNNGKFYMAVTPDGGTKTVIFDYATGTNHNWTQHPGDPNPDGVQSWNAMKLYTSKTIIDAVKAGTNPQSLQVSWDNFRIWRDKQP
ncbi:hypothetical protein GJU39_12865 [Pedobacter petrophilus]|uniref:Uncharacterized protein n=2 Tax=Pedobacter TaxID=84567 RepID=A0A7K0FZH8_9SPHI|nr:hypothetical protein [Pedobacter petrophilus]MRX76978.1 hypothetical protein [Pedobacter petrophilus]